MLFKHSYIRWLTYMGILEFKKAKYFEGSHCILLKCLSKGNIYLKFHCNVGECHFLSTVINIRRNSWKTFVFFWFSRFFGSDFLLSYGQKSGHECQSAYMSVLTNNPLLWCYINWQEKQASKHQCQSMYSPVQGVFPK